MPRDPNDNYTNSALRAGDSDPYPQRLVGEFISQVVSNDWVNDEYKLIVLKVHAHALKTYAGGVSPSMLRRLTAPKCGCGAR